MIAGRRVPGRSGARLLAAAGGLAALLLAGCSAEEAKTTAGAGGGAAPQAAAPQASAPAAAPAAPQAPQAAAPGVLADEARCARNRAAGPLVYISGYGYSASAGQLDVFLAKELGYFDALCLTVEINAAGANGQQLVSSGRAQFTALGSASDVILAAANSGNLTAIATYGFTSPFSIFAHEEVKTLKDLEGRKLGYFINITPIALAMLEAAGVDVSKVELIKMTNYDPTVVPRGQVDAIVGYASNQPERLRELGLPFNEFKPADFGLQGTYNVMEVNSQFLRANRPVVADFMRATLKALEHCLAEEEDCVARISRLAEENNQGMAFPLAQQRRTWAVESSWVRGSGGPPGAQALENWTSEYDLAQSFGGLKDPPPLAAMMDPDLVAALYADGRLIWPGE